MRGVSSRLLPAQQLWDVLLAVSRHHDHYPHVLHWHFTMQRYRTKARLLLTPIPGQMYVRHSCRMPCVDHHAFLWLGTQGSLNQTSPSSFLRSFLAWKHLRGKEANISSHLQKRQSDSQNFWSPPLLSPLLLKTSYENCLEFAISGKPLIQTRGEHTILTRAYFCGVDLLTYWHVLVLPRSNLMWRKPHGHAGSDHLPGLSRPLPPEHWVYMEDTPTKTQRHPATHAQCVTAADPRLRPLSDHAREQESLLSRHVLHVRVVRPTRGDHLEERKPVYQVQRSRAWHSRGVQDILRDIWRWGDNNDDDDDDDEDKINK